MMMMCVFKISQVTMYTYDTRLNPVCLRGAKYDSNGQRFN